SYFTVSETFVDLTRMHYATLTNEIEQQPCISFLTSGKWRKNVIGRNTGIGPRMHQRLQGSRDITVVDEKIFFNVERRIATLEIAGVIRLDAMTQYQVLGPCGSANRIGLYEAHLFERTAQCCWSGKVSGDRESSQVVDVDWHIQQYPQITQIIYISV